MAWIDELLSESLELYRGLEEDGTVPFDLQAWPMLLLAVEERELEPARAYAEALGARKSISVRIPGLRTTSRAVS